jgi:hypothetical protein
MKRFLFFSALLFMLTSINNRLFAQIEEFYHPTIGLFAATSDSRVVTHIREEGDEIHLEGLIVGYLYVGTVEYSLYYDADVVFPIWGPGGLEITERTENQANWGPFLLMNPKVPSPVSWRQTTTGDLNPESPTPYFNINTGGALNDPASERYVQAGELFPIFKVFFKKRPGKEIDENTFVFYDKHTIPPRRNDYNINPLYLLMSGTPSTATYVRTFIFVRRIKSDVTTINYNLSGTSATLTGLAEIVDRDVNRVPVDLVGQKGGLDWDTILTTGFIYGKHNVAMSVEEYTKTLNIAGTDYNFPNATEIAAGVFTRGSYTFNVVSTENTARSYEINMSQTIHNLDPVTEYCAYSFLLYRFQTSDPYPV